MKVHHWILLIVSVLIVGGLLLWPKAPTTQSPTDELTGTWSGGGVMEDGSEWWMKYEFYPDTTYKLTTNSGYGEEGQYVISERFLDGSIEIQKTWDTPGGEKFYEFIIMTTDDSDVILLEGVTLTRQ